jgi:hypothetical protein
VNSSEDTTRDRTKRPQVILQTFKAGAIYFSLVFGAGFVLGSIRVLWVVPRFGDRIAELMETPIMLVVTILAARWVVGRFALPLMPGIRLGAGFIALGFLLVAEFTVVLQLRGLTIAQYYASRDPIAEAVYIVMLGVFAVMPLLVARR